MPNEIPVVFHNGANYDYDFIILSWGKSRKVHNFFCSNRKEVTKIDKEGNGNIITISYKVKFIGSAKFMAISLSSLADNLVEEIHKIKCKTCDCFLEYESDKVNSIKYNCLTCKKDYRSRIDKEFKKRFKTTFKFSNNDTNKFILLLRKSVYPLRVLRRNL